MLILETLRELLLLDVGNIKNLKFFMSCLF